MLQVSMKFTFRCGTQDKAISGPKSQFASIKPDMKETGLYYTCPSQRFEDLAPFLFFSVSQS